MLPAYLTNRFSKDFKLILENITFLVILQALNYLLPFITLPYLARVLGLELFGLLAFALSISKYIEYITNYGFDLTATREISKFRNDAFKVSEIFSAVLIIKVFLIIIAFSLLLIFIWFYNNFAGEWKVYVLFYGIVVGNGLFPVWYFQGIENMKYITYFNILSKSLFVIAIFIFIKGKSDYLYVPILHSISSIFVGVTSIYMVAKTFKVKIRWINFKTSVDYLKMGFYNFASIVSGTLFNTVNVIILGTFTSNVAVGVYSGAERIITAIYSMIVPIVNGIYPYITKKYGKDFQATYVLFMKFIKIIFISFFLVSILVYIFSSNLVNIILGKDFYKSISVLKLLSFLPLIVALNISINILFIVSVNLDHLRTYNLIIAGIFNLVLCTLLTYKYSYIGTSISFISSQCFFLILSFKTLIKHKNHLPE